MSIFYHFSSITDWQREQARDKLKLKPTQQQQNE